MNDDIAYAAFCIMIMLAGVIVLMVGVEALMTASPLIVSVSALR